MQTAYDVIIRPIVTERSFDLMEQGKYTFEVARTAPKEEIAAAVEKLFGVHVIKVNTMWVKSKNKRVRYQMGKTRTWKKAVVKLSASGGVKNNSPAHKSASCVCKKHSRGALEYFVGNGNCLLARYSYHCNAALTSGS